MSAPKPSRTSPGTPPRSEQSLSEAARHLVLPTGIVATEWPAVRDQCRKLGIRFQRWQDGAGRCILAKRADGLYAAGIGGVVLSVPRQVGKTFLIGAILFALCLLRPGLLVLWTAHRARTSNETFRSMQGMARRKAIKPHIEHVHRGSGDQEIEFRNGSRIMFGAREHGFGRGIPGVAVVVFDEGQILTDDAVDDMVPAANTAENPLIIYTGTPPKPTDPGEVFTRLRGRALSGQSENTLYVEISADPDVDPTRWAKGYVDWDQVAKANPSFPLFTPRASILRLLEHLGLGSFRLEGLGIWPPTTGPEATIPETVWAGRATRKPPVEGGRVAVGIRFSLDGLRVAAAIARKPAGGGPHVEVLGEWAPGKGIALLAEAISKSWKGLAQVVIDGKAGQQVMVQALRDAGVPAKVIITPTTDQVIGAHTTLLAAVTDSTLTHNNQPGLNASVASATQRLIGKAGGWGWEPIGDGDDLPVGAATLAVWGAVTSKRRPGRKAGVRVL